MNTRRAFLLLPLLLAAPPLLAHHAEFRTLRPGGFNALVAARRGQPFLLVLWSLACEACQPDLQLLRDLRREHPDMPLALVSVDGVSLQQAAGQALIANGLEHESIWIFSNRQNPMLRQEVDPAWDGGVPRAYFYDAAGGRETVAGNLDRARVEAWLAAIKPAG
jgi:hypothetical protein